MFKYRIRMFFNELKVLLLMHSDTRRRSDSGGGGPEADTRTRGLSVVSCGWPLWGCSPHNDEEEYYGSDPRPQSLTFEEKEAKVQSLEAASLPSLSESSMRSPQCRICFQGPDKVNPSRSAI